LKLIVARRLAPIVALDLALCAACGTPSTGGEGSLVDAVLITSATSSEANCRGSEPAPGSGAPLWLDSYDEIEISSTATDRRGNVLIARSGVETLALGCDGQQLWSVPFGARVAVDDSDNVYIAGESGGSPFVVKLDAAGAPVYRAELGAEVVGVVESLAVDGSQNVAISGPALGTWKLDAAGVSLWSRPFAGQLAFDGAGDLWLTGALEGTRDFAGTTLTSRGGADVLLLELAPDGALRSARSFGDAGSLQRGEAIAVDAASNVLITGTFDGSVDFGAGALNHRSESCSPDAWCLTTGFVAKLDAQGGALWSVPLGLTRSVPGVAVDTHGDIAVSSVLPGGVRPFRRPRIALLGPDAQGLWQRSEWPDTGVGAGHAVTFDANQDLIWSVSARPSHQLEEHAYLAKLAH
jgi:hypothetical protein